MASASSIESGVMETSTKWLIGIVVFLAVAVLVAVLAVLGLIFPLTTDSGSGGPDPAPQPVAPITDGEWFAYVMVGEDETGEVTLGVDLAEMLTGEEAHDAAVDAGVIEEDEDLPNDYFIDNPVEEYQLVYLVEEPHLTVLSGNDPAERIIIDTGTLASLYEGTYQGPPVYGIVAHLPIVMDIVIEDGLVSAAEAVYLP